jgi:hypothetical protein
MTSIDKRFTAPTNIPNSSLTIEQATPDNEDIVKFFFGPEWWSKEIESDFKDVNNWNPKVPLFLFYDKNRELIAGATITTRNLPHPRRDSTDKKRYLLLVSFGVNTPYQGTPDPQNDQKLKYAQIILDCVEQMARADENCFGVSLYVREENIRAYNRYLKNGFIQVSEVFDQGGRPTIELRKIF